MAEQRTRQSTEIAIVEHGEVPGEAVAYARKRLGSLIDHIAEPVLYSRVKLTQAADPARDRPSVAEVTVDVNGDLVRAHVAGHSMLEAIDLVRGRLHDQLEHRHERERTRHRRPAASGPGEWRHGDRPTQRPRHFDRPAEDRQLLQHKTYVIEEITPDEAAFDMEQLDYDFYLFRDLATGGDTLIERADAGSYRLTRAGDAVTDPGPTAIAVTVADRAWRREEVARVLAPSGAGVPCTLAGEGPPGLIGPLSPGRAPVVSSSTVMPTPGRRAARRLRLRA